MIRFVLGSFGQTASRWLTKSLSLFPEPIAILSGQTNWAGQIVPHYERDPEKLFTAAPDANIVGLIHYYNVLHYIWLEDYAPLKGKVYTLVRNPITRIHSAAQSWNTTLDRPWVQEALQTTREYRQADLEKARSWGANLEEPITTCFVTACAHLDHYVKEIRYRNQKLGFSEANLLKMEELTTDREYFRHWLEKLLERPIPVDFINRVFSEENTPITHNPRSLPNAEAVLASWQAWQKQYFVDAIHSHGAIEAFRDFYDWSSLDLV